MHGRSLTQGGSRNCSNDAVLPELVADLGTEFEAALEDALASGLLTPAAKVPSPPLGNLWCTAHLPSSPCKHDSFFPPSQL